MNNRMTARWAAVAAVAAVALACAACSSHGTVGVPAAGGGSAAGAASATTSAGAAAAATTSANGSAGGASPTDAGSPAPAAGGLTPPGTHLKAGQAATVGWVPPGDFSATDAQKAYSLQITVESIEKGTTDDLKNIDLGTADAGSVPFYVKVRIKALDAVPSSVTDNPEATLDGIDDRGQQQSAVIFLGKFDRCPDTEPPKPFGAGKSFETCLTYLMPGGGSIQKMQWGSGPAAAGDVTPYFENPVSWQ